MTYRHQTPVSAYEDSYVQLSGFEHSSVPLAIEWVWAQLFAIEWVWAQLFAIECSVALKYVFLEIQMKAFQYSYCIVPLSSKNCNVVIFKCNVQYTLCYLIGLQVRPNQLLINYSYFIRVIIAAKELVSLKGEV